MKILWLKNNLLHPLDSGGKIRTYNMLGRLMKINTIDYVAYADNTLDRSAISRAQEYCNRIHPIRKDPGPSKESLAYYFKILATLGRRYPFTVTSYYSGRMRNKIRELLATGSYDILVADFLQICLNVMEPIDTPKVHFSHNVESMIWRRLKETTHNPLKQLVFERERSRMYEFEKEVLDRFDFTVAVSKNDYDFFRESYGARKIGYIPTGVDNEYFKPGGDETTSNTILFLGSMDWMPNIDAIHYFVRSIYPLIKAEIPEARLNVVGRSPIESVRKLADEDPSIRVTGTVADTRPFISRAACAVVPIRVGGGTRIKIYEMMAMEKPVISTTVGAEGLSYTNGENILIADDDKRFSEHVIRLLRNDMERINIGRRAREFVSEHCSWDAVTAKFQDLLIRAKESR